MSLFQQGAPRPSMSFNGRKQETVTMVMVTKCNIIDSRVLVVLACVPYACVTRTTSEFEYYHGYVLSVKHKENYRAACSWQAAAFTNSFTYCVS